jgi:crossover junction endodeoxyribonuclease RuvC
MKVLAIDPGYGRCGMAIIERSGGKDALLFSTCVETNPADAFEKRLAAVVAQCKQLLAEHRPDCFAMEKLYFSANRTTAMRVAEVRGALLATVAEHALPVHEYSPSEIKSAAAGHGGADKRQVATMLRALLGIEKHIMHDDEYDAIAVGVTHLASARHRALTLG